jgi:hypothetical protein
MSGDILWILQTFWPEFEAWAAMTPTIPQVSE